MKTTLIIIGLAVVVTIAGFALWPDEVTQIVDKTLMGKRFTTDGWEIIDSCVTTTYAQFRCQGLVMQGYSAGMDRMETPCDSTHAYYIVRKERKPRSFGRQPN